MESKGKIAHDAFWAIFGGAHCCWEKLTAETKVAWEAAAEAASSFDLTTAMDGPRLRSLIESASYAVSVCHCTEREKTDGHRIGCHVPGLDEALAGFRFFEKYAAAQRASFHETLNDLCIRHGATGGEEKLSWLDRRLTELEHFDARMGERFGQSNPPEKGSLNDCESEP